MGAVEDLRNDLHMVGRELRHVEDVLARGLSEPAEVVRLRKRQVELLRRTVSDCGSLVDQYDLLADDLHMAYADEQLEHHRALMKQAVKRLRAARREARRIEGGAHHGLLSRWYPLALAPRPLDLSDH